MKSFFIALCVALTVGMVYWKLTQDKRERQAANDLYQQSSDAQVFDDHLTILGDDWLGYMIFRSRKFQEELAERKVSASFEMEFDFAKRFKALEEGKADFVVATVDSYLSNGGDSNFPGVITHLVDESFGGDAIIVREEIKNIDDLGAKEAHGCFVGSSPSEFLLKSQIAHFKLDDSRMKLHACDSIDEAYEHFASGEGDFAVLWEPQTSKALREIPGTRRLIDTSDARGLIIDCAIARRQLVVDRPDLVESVVVAYFKALNHYLGSSEELLRLAQADTGEKSEIAEQMLRGIRFTGYQENLRMAGIDGAGKAPLLSSIGSITDILLSVGDLKADPLRGNARSIVNSAFLEKAGGDQAVATAPSIASAQPSSNHFKPLSEDQWRGLMDNPVGTLLDRPIVFASGRATVPEEFQIELKGATDKLAHYPDFRVVVQAHVSKGSDPEADQQLSQQRADAIRDLLVKTTDMPAERIRAFGIGAEQLLEKMDGESLAAWKRRCRRARVFIADPSS